MGSKVHSGSSENIRSGFKSWHMNRGEQVLTAQKIKGIAAECLVCWYLKQRGWTILDRNYATRYGEIDIIALKMDEGIKGHATIAFVEVKSLTRRSFFMRPVSKITNSKKRKIIKVLRCWKHCHPGVRAIFRCDAAGVMISPHCMPSIDYISSAFTERNVFGW